MTLKSTTKAQESYHTPAKTVETHIVLLDPGCVNVRIWAGTEAEAKKVAAQAAKDLGLSWDGGYWVDVLRKDAGKRPTTNYMVLGEDK